ncbi:MAG: hypothetical protein FWF79_10045 [Defluviitaleaceae bacterium]|nr:hypothetical protein [Defluviitaleaceae bacterium]
MTIIRSTFDWAGDLYARTFADWLHMHFLLRTVLILFVLWLFIFVFAVLLHYLIGPALLMFFYHVIFRAWNYLFVETPQEWIFIRYHSKDRPNFSEFYKKLCDKVKQNRVVLSHTKYRGMVMRSRRIGVQFMITCAIAATLWASAFGLHHEYAAPVLVLINEENNENAEIQPADTEEDIEISAFPYSPGEITPSDLPAEDALLSLNELGASGSRLRDGPGITGSTIIEILWDNDVLVYLNAFVPDAYVNGLYWLRVLSPAGTEGYIGSQLVEAKP